MKYSINKGISFIEIIIVISIMVILAIVVLPSLSNFRNQRTLDNTTQDVISILNKARNDTVSSLNSNTYGVHFETNKVTYFAGSIFNASDTSNVVFNLDSNVNIPPGADISINGGGSDVVFNRIKGDTTDYGTITIRLVSNSSIKKIVTISQTGSISSN